MFIVKSNFCRLLFFNVFFLTKFLFQLPVFKTSVEKLENRIKQLADENDVSVLGQSLKGFTPKEAYDIGCHALLNGISVSWKERSQKMM